MAMVQDLYYGLSHSGNYAFDQQLAIIQLQPHHCWFVHGQQSHTNVLDEIHAFDTLWKPLDVFFSIYLKFFQTLYVADTRSGKRQHSRASTWEAGLRLLEVLQNAHPPLKFLKAGGFAQPRTWTC